LQISCVCTPFHADKKRRAAQAVAIALTDAPAKFLQFPHREARLEQFGDREVRRPIVGAYEIRYELTEDVIRILQIWRGKERIGDAMARRHGG
jgi:hypothetical protein